MNAVIDHNHTCDIGMQFELYKHNNPRLSKGTHNIFTYGTLCLCDNFRKKWRQSKEVDIDNMMDALCRIIEHAYPFNFPGGKKGS